MKPVSTMLSPDVTCICLLLGKKGIRLCWVQGSHARTVIINLELELTFSACWACLPQKQCGVHTGECLRF